MSRFFATRAVDGTKDEVSEKYMTYSEDYLLLPGWTKEKPQSLPEQKIAVEEGKVLNINEKSVVDWEASIVATEGSKVIFNSLYFPGWFVEVDGDKRPLLPGDPYGQSEVVVTEGNHKLRFYWAETRLRKFANLITLTSFVFAALFFYKEVKV